MQHWNYVVLVYNADDYGETASKHFREIAQAHDICIAVDGVATSATLTNIYTEISKNALQRSIAVVYFGMRNGLLSLFRSSVHRPTGLVINWVVSTVIPETVDFQTSLHVNDTMTHVTYDLYSSQTGQNTLFKNYLWSVYFDSKNSSLSGILKETGQPNTDVEPKHVIDAVLTLALAANATQQLRCGGLNISECLNKYPSLFRNLTHYITSNTFDIERSFDESSFYPYKDKRIEIDTSGYQVNNVLRLISMTKAVSIHKHYYIFSAFLSYVL